eukprot:6068841-Prymnesium_polylepis.1
MGPFSTSCTRAAEWTDRTQSDAQRRQPWKAPRKARGSGLASRRGAAPSCGTMKRTTDASGSSAAAAPREPRWWP